MRWFTSRSLLLVLIGSLSTFVYLHEVTLASYLRVFFSLFALYLLALLVSWRQPRHASAGLIVIVGFALVFRLIVVFSPVVLSSDVYRYVWDGRVQRAGHNPYRYPPEAEALVELRDPEIYPRINRPWLPTIYPPVAQMLFTLTTAVWPDSVRGMKALMALCDMATICLLLRLLNRRGDNPQRVLLYAWSPLAIIEFAGSGHVDALMLPFMMLALLCRMTARAALSGVMLGLATLIKLYPALLFPALYTRHDRRFPLAFGVTVAFGYLPYISGAGLGVLGYLPGYFGPWEDFNGGLRYFLTSLLQPYTASAWTIAAGSLTGLFLALLVIIGRHNAAEGVLRRVYWTINAYLLLVPAAFYPWYMIWLLPCLCIYVSWGWLYLSGAIALSYLAYGHASQTLPGHILLIEFLPLYILLGGQAVWRWRTGALSARQQAMTAQPSGYVGKDTASWCT